MKRPPRILICWEIGAGLGHALPLSRIGRMLNRGGAEVRYVFQNTDTAALVDITPDQVRKAPDLRMFPYDQKALRASLGDAMADTWFRDSDEIARRTVMWQAIFASFSPDVIISDYSPGANIAARDRYPVLSIGQGGYTAPPHHLDMFPHFTDIGVKEANPEARTLERINRALKTCGVPGLERLPQVFEADRTVLATFAQIDPYAEHRRDERYCAPVLPHHPRRQGRDPRDVFVYAGQAIQRDERFVRGLLLAGLPGLAVIGAPLGDMRIRMSAIGMRMQEEIIDLATVLPDTAVCITQGSHGVFCSAIAAGVPQITLYTDMEKRSHAMKLREYGTVAPWSWDHFTADWLASMIRSSVGYQPLRDRARKLADQVAPCFAQDPTELIATAAIELVSSRS